MMSNKFCGVLMLLVLCFALQVSEFGGVEGVISCGTVQNNVAPCLGFLMGRQLAPGCCPGLRSLVSSARTTADRRTACVCLQSAARNMRGINYGNAAALPRTCGISISFPINPNINCNTIG